MPIIGVLDPVRALGKEWVLVQVTLTVGATGAVTSAVGRGFDTATPSGETAGGIVRVSEGVYTVTLPGRGSVQAIVPLGPPVIEDADAADAKVVTITAKSLSARTMTFTFWDAAAAAAVEELTEGSVVYFTFLVKNSNQLA